MDEQRKVGQTVANETAAQERLHKRLGGRLMLGALAGAAAGLGLGAVVGLLLFDRPGAIWASVIAIGVFGFGVGLLVFGYSSLESPDPGAEPSDTERPIADRPGMVRDEEERPGG